MLFVLGCKYHQFGWEECNYEKMQLIKFHLHNLHIFSVSFKQSLDYQIF